MRPNPRPRRRAGARNTRWAALIVPRGTAAVVSVRTAEALYQRGSPRSDRSHRDGLTGQMPPRPARGPGRAAAREAPERLSRAAARPAGQTAAKGIDSPGRL